MAAARTWEATLKTGFTLHCAVRPSCHRALFLLPPCRRLFNNTTPSIEADNLPPDPPVQTPQPNISQDAPINSNPSRNALNPAAPERPASQQTHPRPQQPRGQRHSLTSSARYDPNRAPTAPVKPPTSPLQLTPAMRQYLPHLTAQPPYYITIHIHGKPYLVTEGDTIRLPFLMHGVMPGDVLRLDRASILGSREWTLRSGSPMSDLSKPNASTLGPQDTKEWGQHEEGEEEVTLAEPIIGKTSDIPESPMNMHQMDTSTSQLREDRPKRRNKPSYLDPRLFLCRATVLGTESEPMRILEKTKQRQRKVKRVKSRMRFTILRIREVKIKSVGELDSDIVADERYGRLKKVVFAR